MRRLDLLQLSARLGQMPDVWTRSAYRERFDLRPCKAAYELEAFRQAGMLHERRGAREHGAHEYRLTPLTVGASRKRCPALLQGLWAYMWTHDHAQTPATIARRLRSRPALVSTHLDRLLWTGLVEDLGDDLWIVRTEYSNAAK